MRGAIPAAVLLVAATLVAAAPKKVEPLDSTPASGVPDAVKKRLAPSGFRVVAEGKTIAEFWPASTLPTREAPARPGIAYASLAEGAFVGLVRFPDGWRDFRNARVAEGLYTLRYAIEPADGNHMGVSEFRDFLILAPAAEEKDPAAPVTADDLVALGRKASGRNHPAVMALLPAKGKPDAPAITASGDKRTVVTTRVGSMPIAIVFEGHAEAEGY